MSDSFIKIETGIYDLMKLKTKLADAKIILKSYKIQSERLAELKKMARELRAQMEEEKHRIEQEFLEDQDYEDAKTTELKLVEEIREKTAQLRELVKEVNKKEDLVQFEYKIDGEPVKVQVERSSKLYINGTEQR